MKHIILEKKTDGTVTNMGKLDITENSFHDGLLEDVEEIHIHPVDHGIEQAPKWVRKELGYNEKIGKDAEKIERANMFLEDAELRTDGKEVNTFDLETAKTEAKSAFNLLQDVHTGDAGR